MLGYRLQLRVHEAKAVGPRGKESKNRLVVCRYCKLNSVGPPSLKRVFPPWSCPAGQGNSFEIEKSSPGSWGDVGIRCSDRQSRIPVAAVTPFCFSLAADSMDGVPTPSADFG